MIYNQDVAPCDASVLPGFRSLSFSPTFTSDPAVYLGIMICLLLFSVRATAYVLSHKADTAADDLMHEDPPSGGCGQLNVDFYSSSRSCRRDRLQTIEKQALRCF
jgi:hypothetical protein